MKNFIVVLISLTALFSCSNDKTTVTQKKSESTAIPTFEKADVDATKLLTIQIGGMSCEMGCGGAIRKELYATNAVDEVTYDFKMGRDFNEATIAFDDSKINDEKIIDIIKKINNNQFTVKDAQVSNLSKQDQENKAPNSNASVISSSKTAIGDQNMVKNIGQSIVALIVKSLLRN